MKVYILTKKGTKTPVRDWDGNIICYPNKQKAIENKCTFGTENLRKVILKINAKGLDLGVVK